MERHARAFTAHPQARAFILPKRFRPTGKTFRLLSAAPRYFAFGLPTAPAG